MNKIIPCKLVNQNMTTHGNTKWKIGIPKETSGIGTLCSGGWLHYYNHPLLAVLFNPIHANIVDPKLFAIKAEGILTSDNGVKEGCTKLTLLKEISLPEINLNSKITFGILCTKQVYKDAKWNKWADLWLANTDRSAAAAARAAAYAAAAARAVAYAATHAAAATAYTAAYAAAAAHAATHAAAAATAVAYAATHAAYAATAVAYTATHLNLIDLASRTTKFS